MSQYNNPPLIEAVCEFRFAQSAPWRDDIVDLLYPLIQDTFPIKDARVLNNLQVHTTPKKASMQMQQKPVHVFWNKDKTMLIQAGIHYLSIHALKPYPSWKKFGPIINEVFNSLSSCIEITKFERIGFVYIDKIEIPEKTIRLDEYFNLFPHIGPELPQNLTLFNMSIDIPYEDIRDICRISLSSTIPEKEPNSALLLTTDYFLIDPSQVEPKEVMRWITTAHDHISELFEGIITKKLRDLFNE